MGADRPARTAAVVAGIVAAGAAATRSRARVRIAASKKATHASAHGPDGQERARRGQADQLPEQPDASCRRARPPSTSPVIAESCGASGDASCALPSDGSTQPLDVESIIARWTSLAYCGPCICLGESGLFENEPTAPAEHRHSLTLGIALGVDSACGTGRRGCCVAKGPGAVRTLVSFAFGKLLFCGA